MAENVKVSYTGMKMINKDLFDYTDGNVIVGEYLQKLREEENVDEITEEGTMEDFLKIPLNEKYIQNKGLNNPLNSIDLSCNIDVNIKSNDK